MTISRGQSSVEYLVACAVVWALIAVPIGDADSALELMMTALQTCYARFSAALSLPV